MVREVVEPEAATGRNHWNWQEPLERPRFPRVSRELLRANPHLQTHPRPPSTDDCPDTLTLMHISYTPILHTFDQIAGMESKAWNQNPAYASAVSPMFFVVPWFKSTYS